MRPAKVRGLCLTHYGQWHRGLSLTPIRPRATPGDRRPCLKRNGYVYIHMRTGWKLEHRVIMEEYLGRSLSAHETVHHKNGMRNDNRLENLEIWDTRHPKGQRVDDKVEWAIEILREYAPERLT